MTGTSTAITTERIRHQLKFRIAEVVSNTRITPNMARIVVETPDLEGFSSPGYDDHVKLFFAPANAELAMPQPGPNGLEFPEGAPRPEGRDYTPRHFDPETNRLTLDFVIHGDGIATSWAASARPGDKVGVGGPRASFLVRGEPDWHLLVGDETALPAIGRRIEELGTGSRIIAVIEIANAAERQSFETGADLHIDWIERDGIAAGMDDRLLLAIRNLSLPEGSGYAFIAGEAATSKAIRKHLVEERGMSGDHVKAAGYWQLGEADFYDGHEH